METPACQARRQRTRLDLAIGWPGSALAGGAEDSERLCAVASPQSQEAGTTALSTALWHSSWVLCDSLLLPAGAAQVQLLIFLK